MMLGRLLPKSYTNQLILMMFFFGLIPFLIFGILINIFDQGFRAELEKAIEQRQIEENHRSMAVLKDMAEETIRQKALDVALQIELFLKAHSGETLAQLQNNSEFRKIAVQSLCQTGYTVVFNGNNGFILFHKNAVFENLDMSTLFDDLTGLWAVVKKSLGGNHSHGYYDWKDADGSLRSKFMYMAPVKIKTADKVSLMVAATAYVEDFTRPIKISQDASRGTSRFLVMTFQNYIGLIKQRGFLFLGIGLIINLALAFWVGTFFSITIVYLRRATKAVMDGWLDVHIKSNMIGDVGELSKDFNRMVVHLKNTTVKKEALEANQKELSMANALLREEVSERKRVEAALRESGERLRAILETNPSPIVLYNKQGFPEYINAAFSDLFGWSLNELKGLRIPFVPHEMKEETISKLSEVLHSAKIVRLESQRLTNEGHTVDVLISAAPFEGPLGEVVGMVVNYDDITEIKQLKERLLQAQKMEAIGTLAGGIAHNFNNVLMGIVGLTSLMRAQKDPSDPDYEQLTSIEEYGMNAAELTSALLAFARGGKYQIVTTDLNQLVGHEAEMFGRTKKELTIIETYGENLWAVDVDQGQMRQVFMNLYVNAWQAMPEGGHLYIKTENMVIDENYMAPYEITPGRYVRVSLTDTGVGMDKETKEKIFEPFFTTRATGNGKGLGLASVYGIVKNHNGFINVYSEVGNGTTFTIYFPASDKKVEVERMQTCAIKRGTETILLVDDEEMIIDVGSEILKALGYSVLDAKNGKEALVLYEKNKDGIDVVIMDMIMPGMGAAELYGKFKEINPHIKVLLSSGYSMTNQAEEILALGCNGFIQKPFNIANLSEKLRSILEGG